MNVAGDADDSALRVGAGCPPALFKIQRAGAREEEGVEFYYSGVD